MTALSDNPVVLLNGARQTGKSTLVQWIAENKHPARYFTLDNASVLAAASSDPSGFLKGVEGPVIIDEIQRVPDLLLSIKQEVDTRRSRGRFLLTGSADILLLPRLSESLTGRMEILTLWPFSQGELAGTKDRFVDSIFDSELPRLSRIKESRKDLFQRMMLGGFPEAISRNTESRRTAWFDSYITTILQRDIRDISNIESLNLLPRLLTLLAARATKLVSFSEISRDIVIPQSTLKRYIILLEAAFLVQTLPAWSSNLTKRAAKAPKLLFADTGLLSYALGLTPERLTDNPNLTGSLMENFVAMEIRKQIAWSKARPRLFHFRMHSGQEVDLVLENRSGNVVGIEVKASNTISDRDLNGLRLLEQSTGKRFRKGIVLYTGEESVPFGPRLYALPIQALWQ